MSVRSANPTKSALYAREYYAKNREAIRAKALAKTRTDETRRAEAARARAMYYRQNIEKWRAMGRAKRGLPDPTRPCPNACEICGRESTGKRALDLDHCHVTGRFRGWLCNKCNTGIGALGDNVASLIRALQYLTAFEGEYRG